MHNEQLDNVILLGKPGKGKSFKVILDDMKQNPEKYNKCVYDYYGAVQKENEEIRKQLLENGIYIGQDTDNSSDYVSKSIENDEVK